ncbi:hypothetical protein AVEN_238703-1 [Araneus ventricosus]|uniref:Uncharacterized protein n=1 Tax=Araneus ventricosus TaxID=182803 RepID=A0A4Y2BWM9_ARAVE|nr:hypothetical protein AVEN_238703-1 [Araneus ventricosus]
MWGRENSTCCLGGLPYSRDERTEAPFPVSGTRRLAASGMEWGRRRTRENILNQYSTSVFPVGVKKTPKNASDQQHPKWEVCQRVCVKGKVF